jgi:hypothetical protein
MTLLRGLSPWRFTPMVHKMTMPIKQMMAKTLMLNKPRV